MTESTIGPAYGVAGPDPRHRRSRAATPVGDGTIIVLAATVAVGVWSGNVVVAALLAVVATVPSRVGPLVLLAAALAVGGAVRAHQAWEAVAPDSLGPFQGWVRVVDDPQPYANATRLIVEVDGERFEVWSRGRAQRLRVGEWRAGERVLVDGVRTRLPPERVRRVAWQHVVGVFELRWASDVDRGDRLALASNRVRASIERAASTLPAADGALFRGLVIGDDRDQPRPMIERFRASGLSHLTAVSGQNVAFVLAACGPALRRLRPASRWLATLALIGWFVVLTRFEPSILRAGTMAGLSATAYATGRERAPARMLGLAVIVLVLVDPLLVWSVGFWLSVGATAGVTIVGPRLAARLGALGPFATPVGITLGAQVGVVVPSLLVFGRLPLVSIPANLLAVPVAGAVMLYGLPAALLAGWVPVAAPALMLPAGLGTRWVDTVARLGERLEPGPPARWIGWIVVAVVTATVFARGARRDENRPRGDPSTDR